MKDFFGNELSVGDSVAYVELFNHTKVFREAEVVGFTLKMVLIRYGDEVWMESLRHPEQLIKDTRNGRQYKHKE